MLNNRTDVLRTTETSFEVKTDGRARKSITGIVSLDVNLIQGQFKRT